MRWTILAIPNLEQHYHYVRVLANLQLGPAYACQGKRVLVSTRYQDEHATMMLMQGAAFEVVFIPNAVAAVGSSVALLRALASVSTNHRLREES